MKRVFTSLIQKDTAAFISSFLTDRERTDILNRALPAGAAVNDNSAEAQAQYGEIMKAVFTEILKGVPASPGATYVDCKYQVVKSPLLLLTSLTGGVFFKSADTCYELGISEAVWINDGWKLATIDGVKKADSSQVNQEISDISAFGSFKFKVESVKLVDDTSYLPPPPAKPSGKRKRQ